MGRKKEGKNMRSTSCAFSNLAAEAAGRGGERGRGGKATSIAELPRIISFPNRGEGGRTLFFPQSCAVWANSESRSSTRRQKGGGGGKGKVGCCVATKAREQGKKKEISHSHFCLILLQLDFPAKRKREETSQLNSWPASRV